MFFFPSCLFACKRPSDRLCNLFCGSGLFWITTPVPFAFSGKTFPLCSSCHPVNFHLVACKRPSDRFFNLLCGLDDAAKINAGLNAHLRE